MYYFSADDSILTSKIMLTVRQLVMKPDLMFLNFCVMYPAVVYSENPKKYSNNDFIYPSLNSIVGRLLRLCMQKTQSSELEMC